MYTIETTIVIVMVITTMIGVIVAVAIAVAIAAVWRGTNNVDSNVYHTSSCASSRGCGLCAQSTVVAVVMPFIVVVLVLAAIIDYRHGK